MSITDECVHYTTSADDGDDETSFSSSFSSAASISSNRLSHGDDEADVDNAHLHNSIISKSIDAANVSNLRRASLPVLQHANRDVAKSHKRIKLSSTGSENADFATLYGELEKLRQLIPSSKLQDVGGKPACIVSASLQHLEDMKKQIRELKQSIEINLHLNQKYIPPKQHSITSAHVEVKISSNGDYIEITVNCKKRKCLMTEMISSLQAIGLQFDVMNVSYHDGMFNFQAVAIPQIQMKPRSLIGEEAVREAILKVIFS